MEMLYIINPANFDGQVLNTMPFVEKGAKHGQDILKSTYVHFKDETFEQYNKSHGGGLLALTWEEFNTGYYAPYLKTLQKSFVESSEEQFMDGLECLPPKRWTRFEGGEFFFVGECYTANLYTCFVRKGEKYYTALRAINTTAENLINLV